MVRRLGSWLLLLAAATLVVSAQPATPPAAGQAGAPGGPQPGRGGGRGMVVSPQVNADKTITLRFRAPNAKEARW